MLKKEHISKIAELLKLDVAALTTAIADEKEVDIAIPETIQTFTAEELTSRDTNTKNEAIKVGKELGVKEVRVAAGLEEGLGKDPAKIAKAITDKAMTDAKIEPDKKVTQLNEQVSLLQKQLGDKDIEIANATKMSKEAMLDAQIIQALPANRLDTMQTSEYVTLLKSALKFEDVDGLLTVKKGDQVLRDTKTQSPLPLADAVASIFTERKWVNTQQQQQNGRGGGDGTGAAAGVVTKKSELIKKYEDEGKSISGQEFMAEMQQIMKDNKDFDVNN